ncbi:hypothetical protein UAY_00842 [Enterococcus moraviensis ATCC BAA-383]|uniref:Choline/carnitine acyltransferase domain-containing protein n=1 Tax=Enterococcus moraviensis ATCC BAA-383 TaxID=1158609 RepID=R2R2J8_9ENTE|nr:choline/carnitine O-acyltransferase [Enterococcus moraviensis]EOI03095.1 hypothetical protein UAY_00842 [Enterococcus moraviensis ATCC BAA-383]EOT74028.1 hypothetical protein I586_01024 [Enterococcus moraviensis ATCC BAA-383]OJG67281.1 hypothetical protein RV09_GL002847 [Enterococcus moraviensis]
MEKYKKELLPNLKKLPVPELQETLVELNNWLRPVVSLEQLRSFQKKAIAFRFSDGLLLQKDLVDYAENTTGSWLAPLWEESYLEGRGYLQTESNFGLVIDEYYYDQVESKEARAAQLIYQMGKIYLSLLDGTFPIEYTKSKQPVDMSFYTNFFKSCRIPGVERDSFFKGELEAADNYVVIFAKNRYFRLATTNSLGELYPVEQLQENLKFILSFEAEKSGEQLIPYVTGVERTHSNRLYHQLKETSLNKQSLQSIENGLFILSFSDGKDESKEDRITEVLLNTSHQFLSKTTQAVITKNGFIGFNMEHTAIDGVPTLNLLTKIFDSFNEEYTQQITGESASDLVQKIEWSLTDEMTGALEEAKQLAEVENGSYCIKHQVVSEVGKERMKKANVSPDAFFHISLAMAQQTVFGKLRSVYEPVAMRMYYEGRTESARSISQEKKQFVEAFYNEEEPTKDELVEQFIIAANAHSERIRQCQNGQGIERHLFGLQKMALNPEEGNVFFSAEALSLLTEDFISTTGIPYEIVESFSFGPVNKAGFGLYYGILDEEVILTLSAKNIYEDNAIQLLEAISEALISLTILLDI